MPQPIIVVMIKGPRAGEVKTRLVPPLSITDAAVLAVCFAQDTVANARRAVNNVLIAYTPADARPDLQAILPKDLRWFEQRGTNLGERLDAVSEHVFNLGFSPIVILGADSPTLPTRFIREAIKVLSASAADITLGPTEDGGYYLVGLQRRAPKLFENIDWSTPSVYQQTASNASALNLRVHELPRWYDVDIPSDLKRLRDELASEEPEGRAPCTYRWFIENEVRSS